MEYYWTLLDNSTTTTVSGHNRNFTPNHAWDFSAADEHNPHLTSLKLGKRHYFEDLATPVTKKGTAVARCQVEGCEAVLLNAKDYHRRHKVCEMHAKAAKVVLLGIEQRFCQQCSRFHALPEFDESKRSCRRRLAGHNQRRRKTSLATTHFHGRAG